MLARISGVAWGSTGTGSGAGLELPKDHSAMTGIDVFTVRVDETEGSADNANAKPAGDSL